MTTQSNRRLALALTASLAANLFLAGALAGGWLGAPTPGPGPFTVSAAPEYSFDEFVRTLPPGGWERMEQSMGARRGDVRAKIAELSRARERVSAALARQPLDAREINSAFAELRARSGSIQTTMHEVVSDIAGHLGAVDRTHMARGLFLFTTPTGEGRVALHDVPLM